MPPGGIRTKGAHKNWLGRDANCGLLDPVICQLEASHLMSRDERRIGCCRAIDGRPGNADGVRVAATPCCGKLCTPTSPRGSRGEAHRRAARVLADANAESERTASQLLLRWWLRGDRNCDRVRDVEFANRANEEPDIAVT